ncbi:threonyl-tRNA synthetase editing domain-containing protein [Plebeiibacterium marinum]|uniref:Threonyl-tRNA synthetase editing domain-containing protein n=1 Tax=Plebeiibacterium marinum TaxID=2992111 RepID=A0AAE3SL54_9BACT|nr:threonyl-tRNA synthetase editing domain-containing protein [Plebeiobacterium marinum]MCW3807545.1 threonyl-tRNA synthetase editing domain-containing protein [Plebeiobacterium marinum]
MAVELMGIRKESAGPFLQSVKRKIMKVLVFYVNSFGYEPKVKNVEHAPEPGGGQVIEDAILAFIQVEESDEEKDIKSREKKLVNHLKWTARKNDAVNVILHSFAHLSESKASFEFTKELFNAAQDRLENGGYVVHQTPFGYFLDLKIDAPGASLARIWASL